MKKNFFNFLFWIYEEKRDIWEPNKFYTWYTSLDDDSIAYYKKLYNSSLFYCNIAHNWKYALDAFENEEENFMEYLEEHFTSDYTGSSDNMEGGFEDFLYKLQDDELQLIELYSDFMELYMEQIPY